MSKTLTNFLAIDASSESCSVALCYEGQTFFERSDEPRSHAQRLLPMVDALLAAAHISVKNLDYIALVHGPGSFTGLRIAISVAQGLAYAAKLPLFCESSLRTMARAVQLREDVRAVIAGSHAAPIAVTALDARMDEIYWAAFSVPTDAHIPPQLVHEPVVSSKQAFSSGLDALLVKATIIAAGEGFAAAESSGIDFASFAVSDTSVTPCASALMSLAQILVQNHDDLIAVDALEPLYLRNEVTWKKRERIRS